MIITKEHLVGFAAGVGVSALSYYIYKKNEQKVEDFLKTHKINIKEGSSSNYENLNLEELVLKKEQLEDLIAEKEMAAKEQLVTTHCSEDEKQQCTVDMEFQPTV